MLPYYYSVNEYIKDTYNCKMYKLALNGGMSCPNRDGLIDTRGCIFCSSGGSGDFAADKIMNYNTCKLPSVTEQITTAKQFIAPKYKGNDYIAYFQSYTNTYAPASYLRQIFYEAISHKEVRILSIATRPDCLSQEVLALLKELNAIKPVWVELGLQTIHENTAKYIRRGYKLPVFDKAVADLNHIGIRPIVHMIIGLPYETKEMMLETANYLAHSGISGVKLQLLHVLKGTDLAKDYEAGLFQTMDFEEYLSCLGEILIHLPPDMVIHRLTGDGPKNKLIAPTWSADKKNVINKMNQYFRENKIYQGRIFQ